MEAASKGSRDDLAIARIEGRHQDRLSGSRREL